MSYQHPEAVFYGRDPEYAEPSGEPEKENPCFECGEEIGDEDMIFVRGLTGRLWAAHKGCETPMFPAVRS